MIDSVRRLPRVDASALLLLILISLIGDYCRAADSKAANEPDRLTFQTSGPWSPRVELEADAAMVYGVDRSLPRRMESWAKHGYRIEVMTGVAWGQYQDYLDGRYDGKNHHDEAQTDGAGQPLRHGRSRDVFYMSPSEAYADYLCVGVRRALDAGAAAIYLEEPEFWVAGGWEPNFRKEWQAFYGQPWQPPDSSPDAQYRASKLKYFLYRRTLAKIFQSVREYGREHHRQIPCYVATHSLLNYAHWRIVSPESSLLDVGCDGYIAQVWTGTSRTPNVYEGRLAERTFETAFLEYGVMQNLVAASQRKMWFLNDPVEDNPNHTWADYKANWENTLTASLLQPRVWRYEIMPWPQRVFNGRYPSADGQGRVPIPRDYETELQAVIHALGEMNQPPASSRWEISGTQGVGVLVSDTMMFQRGGPNASDPHLGSFYGLALPLLKCGVPVEPVQIENAISPEFLKPYRLLLLTYEGQKPPRREFHHVLADWVKAGGALVVLDDDKDPCNAVTEWWNTSPLHLATPRDDLFDELGLAHSATGISRVGRGVVLYEPLSPARLSYQQDGAGHVRDLARSAAQAIGLPWRQTNALVLRRGPYVIAAGLDEAPIGDGPVVLKGRFISLFDADLPVRQDSPLKPGQRALLFDLASLSPEKQGVIAASCAVRDQVVTSHELRFRAVGIEGSRAVVRAAFYGRPSAVMVNGKSLGADSWDASNGTVRLRFLNSAAGVDVAIKAGDDARRGNN